MPCGVRVLPSYDLIFHADAEFLITYGSLLAALLLLWWPQGRKFWWLMYATSLCAGSVFGLLDPEALGVCGALLATSYGAFRSAWGDGMRLLAFVGTLVLSTTLLMGWTPGFSPWIISRNLQLSPESLPFTHYLLYQQGVVAISLLGMQALPTLKTRMQWQALVKQTLPIAGVAMLALSAITLTTDYVGWDMTWTSYYYFWALGQFLFVCAAEETFFRGLIQAPLTTHLGRWRIGSFPWGAWLALMITSACYVLRHIYDGQQILVFTGVASLFYGYAFMRTQKIESPMLVHLALNSIHFLAFTRPVLF